MQLRNAASCCAFAVASLHPAFAQQSVSVAPADARAVVPQTRYESPFAGYRPFRDEKIAPWRDANDEVARAGGHAGIVGGTSAHKAHGVPGPAPATPSTPPRGHHAHH